MFQDTNFISSFLAFVGFECLAAVAGTGEIRESYIAASRNPSTGTIILRADRTGFQSISSKDALARLAAGRICHEFGVSLVVGKLGTIRIWL